MKMDFMEYNSKFMILTYSIYEIAKKNELLANIA